MGGADRETGTQDARENSSVYRTSRGTHVDCGLPKSRGKSSVGRRHAPGRQSGDACRRDDGLKTSQGAVSFRPSTHTHTQAKYHQPYRSRGGEQACIWDAGSGNWERTLVGRSRRVGSSPADGRWGMDDGGDRTLEGGG